jgi:hydrogenase maturation protease
VSELRVAGRAPRSGPPGARPAPPPAGQRVLVLGIGNDLRGDDALGPLVADALEATAPDGVTVRAVHGLTPELVIELARADVVVFVDADMDPALDTPIWAPVETFAATAGPDATNHTLDPPRLLALAVALDGRAPDGYLVSLPARRFDVGAPLTPVAQGAYEATLAELDAWLTGARVGA